MKIKIKNIHLLVFTLLFNHLIAEADNLLDSLYEVFPLRPGIHYSYNYLSYGMTSDEMTYDSHKDSGRIDYIVIDSTITNDSTITWQVIEVRNFQRHEATGWMNSSDTTYFVIDSISLTLSESRSNFHSLTCTGIVWRFPIPQVRWSIFQPIFRFSDSSSQTFCWRWKNLWVNGVTGSGGDTISQSNEFGFAQRRFQESWTSGYMSGNTSVMISAIQKPTSVLQSRNTIPVSVVLMQNYPNPFNPSTSFTVQLPHIQMGSLKVFNLVGQLVAIIKEGIFEAGESTFKWNATNLSNGIYFCRFETNDHVKVIKLLLLK